MLHNEIANCDTVGDVNRHKFIIILNFMISHPLGGSIYGPGSGSEHAGKFDAIAGSSGPAGGAFFFGSKGKNMSVFSYDIIDMEMIVELSCAFTV